MISIRDALKHPQTIPFLGGRERAKQYLAKHVQVYGSRIGISHSDDLDEKPRGRLLFLGVSRYDGLLGYCGLSIFGRLVGVGAAEPRESDPVRASTTREKMEADRREEQLREGQMLEDLLAIGKEYVSPAGRAAFEEKLYKCLLKF
ncbi:hypothetical protein HY772_09255 [Candidatus Woesearchaeota archaeon]|nr:hypothetical protein [Candidatus Woesearchaeota archaeon]